MSPTSTPTYYPTLSPHSISIITTIAGTGSGSFSGDSGQATSATFNDPCGITVDSSNNVYIADSNNNRVRKITASTGIITTYAGNGGGYNYVGDGGQATSAQVWVPADVALDSNNNLYITDLGNHFILKVTASTGIITAVAANGYAGYAGDGGSALSAQTYWPGGIVLDSSDNFFFSELGNHRVRKVTVSTGIISTVAGSGNCCAGSGGYSGDNGQATSATLNYPNRLGLDTSGTSIPL